MLFSGKLHDCPCINDHCFNNWLSPQNSRFVSQLWFHVQVTGARRMRFLFFLHFPLHQYCSTVLFKVCFTFTRFRCYSTGTLIFQFITVYPCIGRQKTDSSPQTHAADVRVVASRHSRASRDRAAAGPAATLASHARAGRRQPIDARYHRLPPAYASSCGLMVCGFGNHV